MSRCLVLNDSYEFLSILECPIRALSLIQKGKARSAEVHGRKFRSAHAEIPIPAVVILEKHVDTKNRKASFEAPSKRNICIRDNFTCQYCGRRVSMATATKDHVIPRSKGGKDSLTNLVTCCVDCNQRKADRTPEEAGMRLLSKPRRLSDEEKLQVLLKTVNSDERKLWLNFLQTHRITLWSKAG
jgi:hypothetical protein